MERNWAGNIEYSASAIQYPRTLQQLQELVRSSERVRALGSRHSFNDIADSAGRLIALTGLEGDVVIDPSARTVTFPAGTRYGDLAIKLESAGWALANLASLPHISVAGAVATSTHGSGDNNKTLSAAVAALELVKADGSLLTIDNNDPDFAGAVVSIGALGVITRITLRIEPTFQMRQDIYENLTWPRMLASFDEITGAGYSVSLNPDWSRGGTCRIRVKSRAVQAPEQIAGARRIHEMNVHVGATECDGSVGIWYNRLPHFLLDFTPSYGDELQSEYLLAREHAPAALDALRGASRIFASALYSTEVRTMSSDELWLSPAYERHTVGIHFTWHRDPNTVVRLLPRIEAILAPFAVRPHWGKLFTMSGAEVRALYPRMGEFLALRDRFDPNRRFTNAYSERVLGT